MNPQKQNPRLLLFVIALAMLLAIVHVGLISISFSKLGLTRESAFIFLFFSLFGSLVNIPLFTVKAKAGIERRAHYVPAYLQPYLKHLSGRTLIAVNLGGCLLPLIFSVYLFMSQPLQLKEVVTGIALVTVICYVTSFPVKGIGIGMPMLVAPIFAAIIAIMINSDSSAPLAYISGTMGVLIGADLLNFRHVSQMGAMIASIGGAGTFDGIFMTGILAVILA